MCDKDIDRDNLLDRVSVLTETIASDPWDFVSIAQRGYFYLRLGRLDKAVNDYTNAINLGAEDAEVYTQRGDCWASQGELAQAIADYDRAIYIDSSYAFAYYNRGIAYQIAKQDAEAILDFTKAIELGEEGEFRGLAYYSRGKSLHRIGQLCRAIADSSDAIQRRPRHDKSYVLRAMCWSGQNEFDKSVRDCDVAVQINARSVNAYCERARSWGYLNRYDKALADYTAAIRLEPCDASLFRGRGIANESLGNYQQAIADHKKSIELDSGHIDSYAELAWILSTCPKRKYRDLSEAMRLAKLACDISSNEHPDCLAALAGVHAATGNFGSAVIWQECVVVNTESEKDKARARSTLDAYRKGKKVW